MRAYFIRALALLCACSLSIGSHYASYILGPLKSRLSREMGTNNTEFSLLISAFSLNSTWTPLVGGVLASRLGTTTTSILATGVVFLGQLFLLMGNLTNSVRLMAFGMFVFGFGVSPLAVVQETIIVRFFKSHGLGVSLALGLVAGKGASFVSARTSYPLSQKFGVHAPFYAATTLAAISFCINLVYLSASKWLVRGAGAELEASELHAEADHQVEEHIRSGSIQSLSEAEALKQVAKKRMVNVKDVVKLGDVFWAYIGLNVLCGAIWAPFTHLAANIIQTRYDMTESNASETASYVLAGSIVLYPVTGYLVDTLKHRGIVLRLFTLSSILTLVAYLWLALPAHITKSPIPAIATFAAGHGFAPLLLVVLVPQIVPLKYVSTTLGAHKALEQTGSTIFQTLAGLELDIKTKKPKSEMLSTMASGNDKDVQYLLNTFIFLNALQLVGIIGLRYLDKKRKEKDDSDKEPSEVEVNPSWEHIDEAEDRRHSKIRSYTSIRSVRSPLASSSSPEQNIPLLRSPSDTSSARNSRLLAVKVTRPEVRRGEMFAVMSGMLIALAWVLFMVTAWMRLRSKEERGGSAAGMH
ncbi:major facilitator superfamily domain-containing protein [Abortiporus biennis]|nr:major facilitator superfamily domain-containing protein [Abortiporus biennis]